MEGRQDRGRGGDREEWRGDRIEGEEGQRGVEGRQDRGRGVN